jgi:hypothetical protein
MSKYSDEHIPRIALTACSLIGFVASAGLLLVLYPIQAPAATLIDGSCATTATKYRIAKTSHDTTSSVYVVVNDTAIRFQQGGSRAGCVMISFSGEGSASANVAMIVKAELDGQTICEPGNNYFVKANSSGASPIADYAMNYVCPTVAPGAHTLRMHFRLDDGSGTIPGAVVHLGYRTTLLHYTK